MNGLESASDGRRSDWVRVLPYTLLIFMAVFASLWLYVLLSGMSPHKEFVLKASKDNGVDPLLSLALIQAESGYKHTARSRKGAMGLMQLMPATAIEEAREMGLKDITLERLEEPEINIRLGVRYLAKLSRQFEGDVVLALAAYNAGAGTVREWLSNGKSLEVSEIPYAETRNFVKKVTRFRRGLGLLKALRILSADT